MARLLEIETEKTRHMDFTARLWYLLKNVEFLTYNFTMTCLFVVVTGIQFWITDYFINVLGVEKSYAFRLYFLLGAVGPGCGVLLCGYLFDKIGGYLSLRAIPVLGIFGLAGMIFGLASVFGDNALYTALMITFQLFCGAFVMPPTTGIMLNQVP